MGYDAVKFRYRGSELLLPAMSPTATLTANDVVPYGRIEEPIWLPA